MKKLCLLGKLLVDTNGGPPVWDPVILISGEHIERILTFQEYLNLDKEGLEVLDCRQKAILPGLIDAHVHLCFTPGPDHEWGRTNLSKEERRGLLPFRSVYNAQKAIKGGITTLRDSGDVSLITLALKKAIQEGLLIGPRIISSGMPITTRNGHLNFCGLIAETDQEICDAVHFLCDRGVDWVKVMVTGGVMTKESDALGVQYNAHQLNLLIQEAYRRDRKVEGHVLNTPAISVSVQSGIDHIAHCVWRDTSGKPFYDEDLAEEIIKKGIIVEMTVSGWLRRLIPIPEDSDSERQAKLDELRQYWAPMRKLWQAGAKILVHSDAGVRLTEFDKFYEGLELMALALDLTPLEVITSATKTPAEALGLQAEMGTVEPGKRADLLVVEMNPLEDLTKIGEIAMVIKDGRVVVLDGHLIT